VIDTNIYISAIFWGGKPRDVIDLGRNNKVRIFTSSEIVNEISEKLRMKFKIPGSEVSEILIDLSNFTFPVEVTKKYRVILDDPDDDKFIDCAVQCRLYRQWGPAPFKSERIFGNKDIKGIRIPFHYPGKRRKEGVMVRPFLSFQCILWAPIFLCTFSTTPALGF
jgi:putative PIN family toxin of toxin-antitoxin system